MNQQSITKSGIKKFTESDNNKHLLIGFDGFIDEIIHVVDKRINSKEYNRIDNINDYAKRIAQYSGLSGNIELVPVQRKIGGNGPILANALLYQGYDISFIGALGRNPIHRIFFDFASKCKNIISLTEPGRTDALEFKDGKIMLGKMNNLVDINWENLISEIPIPKLTKLIASIDLIAFTNWTMLPEMNSIIKGFNEILKTINHKPKIFIDLADPQKRNDAEIIEVLNLLTNIKSETTLGLNENESVIISNVLNISEDDIVKRAAKIRKKLNIDMLVIHPTKGAAVSSKYEEAWISGPYTESPKITTGAGDNFNSGFCNGWLNGLTPSESLVIGVYTSGFYVRNAKSPNKSELIDFININI
ncbi:MAG: PfkB family carbohydrate kinase [Bacteroidales bacterium]|jgi:sugar/nucleoside kinase (ribokinase family)|nr:PfkB family carbohydrate kinase [Bacteroidales bacterium]